MASAGLASKLAGGNFWEGAGTGLVVNLFNDLANHLESYAQKQITNWIIDSQLIAAGYKNVNFPVKKDVSEIYKMIDKVNILKTLYKLGKSSAKFKISDDLQYQLGAHAVTVGTDVTIGHTSFTTYRVLALIIGHELIHVYHNVSPDMTALWNKKYGRSKSIDISEFLAWSWTNSMVGGTNYLNSLSHKNGNFSKIGHLKF